MICLLRDRIFGNGCDGQDQVASGWDMPSGGGVRADRFPVSVKAVVAVDGRVALLRNERDEWELPGGRLEPGETPEQCARREVQEELGLTVRVTGILDCWVYTVRPDAPVVIVTYGCAALTGVSVKHSAEHKAVGLFGLDQIDGLAMPSGYKQSIRRWAGLTR